MSYNSYSSYGKSSNNDSKYGGSSSYGKSSKNDSKYGNNNDKYGKDNDKYDKYGKDNDKYDKYGKDNDKYDCYGGYDKYDKCDYKPSKYDSDCKDKDGWWDCDGKYWDCKGDHWDCKDWDWDCKPKDDCKPKNEEPDPVNDEACVCATETVTIAVLANDTDPDGDTLTVSQINGVNVVAGESVTLATGAVVTLNADGTLSYNSENGIYGGIPADEMLFGTTAADAFTYTVSDGQGGTATANVDIEIDGGLTTVEMIADSLPASVILQVLDETYPDGLIPDDEAWTMKLTGSGDVRFDNIVFDEAYCLEIRTPANAGEGGPDTVDDPPAQPATMALLNDQFDFGANKAPGLTNGQVANAINWILNQDFNGPDYDGMFVQGSSSRGPLSQEVTDVEIQAAIWKLTDNNLFLGQGLGQQADAQLIYDLALANTDFVPEVGDKFGVLIDPTGAGQPFVVTYEFEPYECVCDCDC